jgi:hypothetical protein
MRDLFDDLLRLRSWAAWFAREHGEAPQRSTFGREYRSAASVNPGVLAD